MKYIIALLTFYTQLLYATGSDFSIIIEKPFENSIFDVVQDYNRDISVLGITHTFTDQKKVQQSFSDPFTYLQSISDQYGSKLQVIKMDLHGKIKSDMQINMDKFATPASIIKTPSNGYFIGGHTNEGSLLVIKLDPNGFQEFYREFPHTNKDRMKSLVALADGGILIIGTSFASRKNYDIFDNGIALNDVTVLRLNKHGDIQWSKKFGTQKSDIGIDAIELQDGSFIVLSQTREQSNDSISIMKISQNGEKIWNRTITPNIFIKANKITKLSDNTFVISLTQKDTVGKEQIRLIKLDQENNLLIDKTHTTTYPSELFDIAEFKNGDIFAVGKVRDAQNTDGLVMKVDRNFNLICQEHFGDESYDALNSLAILHNTQIAAVGMHTGAKDQESNMWLIKLNDDCTLAQMHKETPYLYDELYKIFQKEIEAHQVLLKKDLTIELIDTACYFKTGEYKLREEQKVFLEKFSKKMIPFLHNFRSYIQALEINGHTSSEWDGLNFAISYLKNEKLSMNRAYSVLSYLFSIQDKTTQRYLTEILTGSGLAYTQKSMIKDKEDKEKSRKVTFKVITKD